MSYLDRLEENAAKTRTLNGAAAYNGTGDACLDLFALAGGMRYASEKRLTSMFDRAYIENPELAMKLLFHIRDIRGGMGERRVFRTLIRHLALNWPESAELNANLVAEYGRYDDLMCLMGTPVQKEVVRLIRKQLQEDLDAYERRGEGEKDAHISLLAKWLPSENCSSARTRGQAKVLYEALGMSAKEYRKTLSKLRRAICLVERSLSEKAPERIEYEAVPAGAQMKYVSSFTRHDKERYVDYLESVKAGDATIHCDTLFPYEILRRFFRQDNIYYTNRLSKVSKMAALSAEALWNALDAEVGGVNGISVVDVSGSMFCGSGSLLPAMIAESLGLYYAERCKGVFHDHVITFESYPKLVKLPEGSILDRLRYMESMPWGGSTNLEAVFRLILKAAVDSNASQEELPSVIYIFSDMEFNQAMYNADQTVFEAARELYEAYGYKMPAIAFHNVNSWHLQVPVRKDTKGTALSSGASVHSLKEKVDGTTTPLDHMLRVLNSPRYAQVHAA